MLLELLYDYKFLPDYSIDITSNFYRIFEAASTIQRYNKDEMIYLKEDVAQNFYLISSNRVRIFLSSPEETELTIEILRQEKLLGDDIR